jgi:DNA-binding response OmpR family regulator
MRRILVVGDDPELRALGAEGFDVQTAKTGPDALDCLQAEPFAAVVMESAIPGLSGYDVARQIRDVALNRETPIVLVGAERDGRKRGFAAGVDVFMQKPFVPATLLAMVRSVAR